MESLYKLAASASRCPWCHGTTGVETTRTETYNLTGKWSQPLEVGGDCVTEVQYGNGYCLDCKRRFQLSALERHGLVVKPMGQLKR